MLGGGGKVGGEGGGGGWVESALAAEAGDAFCGAFGPSFVPAFASGEPAEAGDAFCGAFGPAPDAGLADTPLPERLDVLAGAARNGAAGGERRGREARKAGGPAGLRRRPEDGALFPGRPPPARARGA